MACEFEEF
jgi:Skp family chaperone for outer membrane proteins